MVCCEHGEVFHIPACAFPGCDCPQEFAPEPQKRIAWLVAFPDITGAPKMAFFTGLERAAGEFTLTGWDEWYLKPQGAEVWG